MSSSLLGFKRERNDIPLESESKIYEKMKTPDMSTDKMNYFLSQIISLYDAGINYSFSFPYIKDKPLENILSVCLWGYLPLYEGRILSFSRRIPMELIYKWTNFGNIDRTFEFFSNIQCLFYLDSDAYKKLSFFEHGKYGFIFEGKKDYFLLINIKSLDKFSYIMKNSDYCQFWLIKIDNKQLLDKLGLPSKIKMVNEMEQKISEFKKIIEEKEKYFESERKEYINRINKMMRERAQEKEDLKEKFNKELNEKTDIIEQFKLEKINSVKRAKKFLGLKVMSNSFFIKDETNVISYEEIEDENKEDKEDNINNQDLSCILCCIRVRNIFFDKCQHCCICDKCLEKCYHKHNKKTQKDEYFCPICNNCTQKDDKNGYTEVKKIFYV
jgi:hypothetical protein